MADFGLSADVGNLVYVAKWGVASTPGASTTKGAWAQQVASTPANIDYVALNPYGADSGGFAAFDLAVGPAGSEVVVVPDLCSKADGQVLPVAPLMFPVKIPAGSRLASRVASSTGTAQTLYVTGYSSSGQSNQVSGRVFTVGMAYNHAGTGTVLNSFAQLTAAMPSRMRYGYLCLQGYNTNLDSCEIQIAVGAAGSEVVIALLGPFIYRNSAAIYGPSWVRLPVGIPEGARVSVKVTGLFGGNAPYVSLIGVA